MSTEPDPLPDPMFFGLLAGGVAGYGAYRADVANVPVIAPVLDWATGHLMAVIPSLQTLPQSAWFWVAGAIPGVIVMTVVAFVFARLERQGLGRGRMQGDLKKRARDRRQAHWAGWNS